MRLSAVSSVALGIVFGILYATLSLLRLRSFITPSFDNAIFEQGIKGYAHGRAPIVDIMGPGANQLGDHFSPIVALVAPFYRLFPSAQTVLVAQAILLGAAVAVIGGVAVRHLGQVRGVSIAVAFGLSFGIQSAVIADFHEVAFGQLFLALAGAAYVDRDWHRVMLWTLPLLLVKEDMGVTVTAVGMVLWLAGQRRRGTFLAVAGIAAMAVVLLVVIPYFSPTGQWSYATKFDGDRSVVTVFFDQSGRKLLTVLLTFGITGLLALASPWSLVAWPILAGRFVADKEFYWGTDWHYSLVLMPIVFVALIDAMQREHRAGWLRSYAARGAAVAVAFAAAMQLHSPLSALVNPTSYELGSRVNSARTVIALVPSGASVETDIALMSHLVSDHRVFWVGSIGDAQPDYVLFNVAGRLGSPADAVAYAEAKHGGTWKLLYDKDGFQLAAK